MCERLDAVGNILCLVVDEIFERFEDALIVRNVGGIFFANLLQIFVDGTKNQAVVLLVTEDDFVNVVSADCGSFEIANGANNVFGPKVATERCGNFELTLNVADNLKTFQFIDAVFEVWAMFLKDIRAKGMISMNLNLVSLWANKISEAMAHVTGGCFGESKAKNIVWRGVGLPKDIRDADGKKLSLAGAWTCNN